MHACDAVSVADENTQYAGDNFMEAPSEPSDEAGEAWEAPGEPTTMDVGSSSSSKSDQIVLFTASEHLHYAFMILAAGAAALMCTRAGELYWFFLGLLAWSLSNMAVRAAAARIRNQHAGQLLSGWFTCLTANGAWVGYHCIAVGAPTLLNESAFILVLALLFLVCHGCAGVLVTDWPQRILMTVMVVAHNTYANSLVPPELRRFSNMEAGLLVLFVCLTCLALASLVPQLVLFYTRAHAAEASERQARHETDMLDAHVAELERARRAALCERLERDKRAPQRRRAAAPSSTPEAGSLRSISE